MNYLELDSNDLCDNNIKSSHHYLLWISIILLFLSCIIIVALISHKKPNVSHSYTEVDYIQVYYDNMYDTIKSVYVAYEIHDGNVIVYYKDNNIIKTMIYSKCRSIITYQGNDIEIIQIR